MNRLARKYRDMGGPPPAKKLEQKEKQVTYGFVIDRRPADVEPEPQLEEQQVTITSSLPEVVETPPEKEPSASTEEEEEEEEETPKKKRAKKPKIDKWLENKEENEATLDLLEKTVFNRSDELVKNLTAISKGYLNEESSSSEEESEKLDEKKEKKAEKKVKQAWTDEAAEEEQSAANREKYEQLVGQPQWAVKAEARLKRKKNKEEKVVKKVTSESESSSGDEDGDGFRKMRDYITAGVSSSSAAVGSPLPSGQVLQMARCADLNQELRHFAQISAIDFYPLSTLALVASHDSTLKLFQVDGKSNSLVHNIVMKQWPIQRAQFNAHTQEIFLECAVTQQHFYGYDLMSEKMTFYNRYRDQGCTPFRNMTVAPDGQTLSFSSRCGYVHLISTRTKELIFSLKRNGEVGGLALSGNYLYASGNDAEVFIWDIRQQRKCVNRFNDSGCIHGTSIAVSRDGSLVACGSDSGIVNLYNAEKCSVERDPKPLKVFKNIVTPVSGIVMNNSSELMMAWSSSMPRVVKAMHLSSRCVFANFPEPEDLRLKNVSAVALSPNSGYLAVGNTNGRVLLWHLHHFSNY